MKKIIVYCEIDLKSCNFEDTAFELVSKARQLKEQALELSEYDNEYTIEAVGIGYDVNKESLGNLYRAGANKFTLIKNSNLVNFSQTIFAKSFIAYFNESPSDIIIFPATPRGRILAPRITTILDTGLVADCTELEFIVHNGELKLAPTRPTFGAELMATILSKKNPQCATIRPHTFAPEYRKNVEGDYCEFEVPAYKETGLNILRSCTDKVNKLIDFSNAKIVFTGGFGLYESNNNSYYLKLEHIAKILGGAFAVTRKVVDFNLMSQTYQIGQTGSTTTADLYIGFGVSGAIQHISGMKNCKQIIAINTDENAEIFKYADYKIVADAKKIIDELEEAINK